MTDRALMLRAGGELADAGDPLDAMRALIEAWCVGVSPETRRARENDLRSFAAFLGVGDDPAAGAWALIDPPATARDAFGAQVAARDKAKAWDAELAARGLAPSSRARMLTSLRSLVREANSRGLPWLLTGVKNPKWDPYSSSSGPAAEVVEARIAWELEHGKLRDYTTLLLFFDVALRVSSIARLTVADCELEHRRIRVWLKGNRTEHRTTSRRLAEALGRRIRELEHEPSAKIDGRDCGGIRAYCHRAGLGHPHGIRHTSGTLVAKRTGDVRLVQHHLAHKNLVTSQIYIDRIRDDAGRAASIIAGEEWTDGQENSTTTGPRGDSEANRAGDQRIPIPGREAGSRTGSNRGRETADTGAAGGDRRARGSVRKHRR